MLNNIIVCEHISYYDGKIKGILKGTKCIIKYLFVSTYTNELKEITLSIVRSSKFIYNNINIFASTLFA